MFPQLLPDRGAIIFTIIPTRTNVPLGTASTPGARVEALDLATGERRTLLRGGGRARYVPTGHLIYAAGEKLYAVAFDVDRLEVRGDPVAVVTQVGEFAVSDEGTLVFESGTNLPRNHVLVWVDRQGREEPLGTPVRKYAYPRLSPDGTRIGAQRHGAAGPRISGCGTSGARSSIPSQSIRQGTCFSRGAPTDKGWRSAALVSRSTICSRRPSTAAGSRSGSWKATVYRCPSASRPTAGCCFRLMYAGRGCDIHALSMDGSGRVEPILDSEANEVGAEVSPDGRWIAYDSDESGQFEIYVRPYPDAYAGGRWLISSGGGRQPLWSRDGSELFYRDDGGAMFAVSVTPALRSLRDPGSRYSRMRITSSAPDPPHRFARTTCRSTAAGS